MRLKIAVFIIFAAGLVALIFRPGFNGGAPTKKDPDQLAKERKSARNRVDLGAIKNVDVTISGGEIEVIPKEDRKPPNDLRVELRIDKVEPTTDGFKYQMIFRGLQPHKYDLRDYLRRKDRHSTDPLLDRPDWHIEIVAGIGPIAEPLERASQKVGVVRSYEVILPGSEIEPIPQVDRKAPIILRMEKVEPTNNGFHYRISCMGLEPGTYDLRRYLRRKDLTSPIPDRPDWHIDIVSSLPPGQIVPKELEQGSNIQMGGYKYLLAGAVLLWGLGFLAIILWPGPKPLFSTAPKFQQTAADRLRPLVESALRGDLSPANQAALEGTLMDFWRRKLALDKAKPLDALAKLKAHPEAGALLRTLEDWLHRPESNRPAVDVEVLLRPYRGVRAEELVSTGGSSP